jgi:hypothetical protein
MIDTTSAIMARAVWKSTVSDIILQFTPWWIDYQANPEEDKRHDRKI